MIGLLKKLPIKSQINGNSAILLLVLFINAGYAIYSMNRVGVELHTIIAEDIPLTEHLTLSTAAQLEQVIHLERALVYGLNVGQSSDAASKYKKEIEKFNKLDEQFKKEILASDKIADEAITLAPDQFHIDKYHQVKKQISQIEISQKNFVTHSNEVFSLLNDGKKEAALKEMEKVEVESDELSKELTTLLTGIEHFIIEAGNHAEGVEKMAELVLIVSLFVSVIVCGLISLSVSKNVSKRLRDAAQGLDFIAKGDLTHSAAGESKDPLQQSIETMRSNLLDMVVQINETMSHLSSNTAEMSSYSSNACTSTQQQQLEIDQITTALNEINATLQEVAENINNTSVAANNANEETRKGREVVEHTVKGIQQLAEQIDNAAEVISQVEQDSENINTVLEVIKSIAEQTNLLALNAAIEAARAGEQGRGFAVVADEVRSLAGRTQESTKEINQIIEKLQLGSRDAVAAIKRGHHQVEEVVEEAKLAGSSLMTIEESVSNIDQMCSQFATATEEQLSVMNEVNGNITRVNDSAIVNAESAEKSSDFALGLVNTTEKLSELVKRFKV